MHAIVHRPGEPLRLADVPDPVPAPGEALVAVRAVSLNYLDAAYRDALLVPGAVPGVDLAGEVLIAAADGTGPPAGTRVAGFRRGSWAQRVAVPTADLAALPAGVDLADAAALPAAGVTALQAVRALGSVLGRRVLVTGASGGVGRYAVQLAARAGADVVALVGRPERGTGLAALGAREVVTTLSGVAALDALLDNVGGPLLAEAFALVGENGLALSIGQASGAPTTIDLEAERRRAGGRRLEPFTVRQPFGADLAVLLDLVARGALDPQIAYRAPWTAVTEAEAALLGRQVAGKAVLEVPENGARLAGLGLTPGAATPPATAHPPR